MVTALKFFLGSEETTADSDDEEDDDDKTKVSNMSRIFY